MKSAIGQLLVVLVLLGAGCTLGAEPNAPVTTLPLANDPHSASTLSNDVTNDIAMPLERAGERDQLITFGMYITPQTSPLPKPESFTGYHTGLDFEIFTDELDRDVPVYAICDGTILYEGTVSGYGGVVIQSCELQGDPVTVLYGHLKPTSFSAQKGASVAHGDTLALLGDAYTSETGGNRKHLHLDIHKGTSIVYSGYVQSKAGLDDFIDPASVLDL